MSEKSENFSLNPKEKYKRYEEGMSDEKILRALSISYTR